MIILFSLVFWFDFEGRYFDAILLSLFDRIKTIEN